MAQIPALAILTAVREVVEDAAGSLRIIAANTYEPGASDGRSQSAQATESLVSPRAEVRFTSVEQSPSSPPELGSFTVFAVELEVTVTRRYGAEHAVSADVRTALRALMATDASRLKLALCAPGNLNTTVAGTATRLVSGCLRYVSSDPGDLEVEGADNGVARTTHTFTAHVQVSMLPEAVTAPSISAPLGVQVGVPLDLSLGTWEGAPITYTAQWNRDGTPIAGATSTAGYTPVSADEGADITCTVTATNDFGAVSATTAAVGPVAPA